MLRAQVALVTIAPGAERVVMPSKTYSALVAGQAILAICRRESDLADLVRQHDCGWVVEPGNPEQLAQTIRLASRSEDPSRAERAAVIARRYNFADAMAGYADLMQKLLRGA